MTTQNAATRLISLDAFRGLTIAAMVLVNNPGDWTHIYAPLQHAKWHGWTITDSIFPFFLFITGVSMALSLGRHTKTGMQRFSLLVKLWKRAAIIFLIGLSLNLIPLIDFSHVRILGVLQRIALCTAIAAPLVLYFRWQLIVVWIAGLLTLYTAIMLYVPVPDIHGVFAVGALEPGRDVGAFIDRLFLTDHMWASAKIWDPEGLFSTIPALCSQLFGVLLGRFLLSNFTPQEKTRWICIAGLSCLVLGSLLDIYVMPINKSLWTSSYCVFMAGFACILFAAFYWFLDATETKAVRLKAEKYCRVFLIYGMNALFIFAFSGVVAKMLSFIKVATTEAKEVSLKTLLYSQMQLLPLNELNTSLLYAIVMNGMMFAMAYFLWKRKWFIKV
jgi:predicted acyltransferase